MAMMSLQAAYEQARSYLETNQVEQAIGVAQHILAYFPENLEAHRILGEAYLAGRQFDQAEQAFARVLRADPESIPAHVGLGITFERQGRIDQAVAEFEQALEVRPDMPELRGQLLRLYTDMWGAEGATLRLSRPGLARLYAKGHMLPQAIQEFRGVIEELPDRFDARVGLAEALWRDGQAEAAAETCEAILAERPDVLKANLLLGYIRLASSDERGEPYWQRAQQLDPYQQVARSIFETLPDVAEPDLALSAWDESAWLAQRAQEEEQRRAQQQPAFAAVAPVTAAPEEDDFAAFFAQAESPPHAPAPTDEADDFLASLLALDSPSLPADFGGELDSSSGVTPFSFDDELAAAPSPPAEPELEAFSLSDLGLSPEEIAELDSGPSTSPSALAEPELEAFSLADLGLSPEEIAELDSGPSTSPSASAEPELEAFSLADLGLSPEEIAELDSGPSASAEPELEAFSLADLGLSPEEIAELDSGPSASAEPELEAFSLADLGLSPEEIAELESSPSTSPSAPAEPELEAFSLADLGLDADEIAELESSPSTSPSAPAEPELEAFSLADLGLDADEIAQLNAATTTPSAPAEPELEAFSLADLGLSPEEIAELESGPSASPSEPELEAFSLADLGLDLDEIAQFDAATTTPSTPAEPELEAFSLADLGLDADEIAQLDAATITPSEPGEAELSPFSLADLGLSPEEIAELNTGTPEGEANMTPFSLDDLGLSAEEPVDTPSAERFEWSPEAQEQADQASLAADLGDLQPFSLDDLDLNSSGDEPDFGSLPPSLQPFSLDEAPPMPLPSSSGNAESDEPNDGGGYSWQQPSAKERTGFGHPNEDEAAPGSIFRRLRQRASERPPEEPEPLTPVADDDADVAGYFSNDDVSLRDEEPGSPERLTGSFRLPREDEPVRATPKSRASASKPPVAAPDAKPFSLAHMGLTDEEIAELERAKAAAAAPAPAAAEPSPEPELTPFSLADLGLSPDEIAELEQAQAPAESSPEPELTPFSLADLGLSPDEIAELEQAQAPAEPSPEPELTPFSLADLGLSPDEIAELEQAQAPAEPSAASETPPTKLPTPATPPAEPTLSPFSLADLGLSAEEIAMLERANQGDLPFPVTGETIVPGWSKGEEPELTPFSVDEAAATPTEPLDTEIDAFDFSAFGEEPAVANELTAGVASDVEPFSFDEFDFDSILAESTVAGSEADFDESVGDVEPFSLDDLGLGDIGDLSNDSRELSVTAEELAGLDLGEFETLIGEGGTPMPNVSDDPAAVLDSLISLGRKQGFVDLTDIISVVSDPEAEAERIEELGWALHNAGIEIRDGDEVIDLEGESEEEEEFAAEERTALPVSDAEADLTPFSFADLGLSADELATLGLDQPTTPPTESPAAPVSDEPELTPFSLADLGLSPEEIAMLEQSQAQPEASQSAAPAASAPEPAAPVSDEPELTPFSLADLGLSPEEIAMLEQSQAQPEASQPAAPAASTPAPEPTPAPAATPPTEAPAPTAEADEPKLMPFSLADLGLSPEEIALLEQSQADEAAAATETAPASDEVGLTPFSLADLGLSADEIAMLEQAARAEAQAEAEAQTTPPSKADAGDDPFDFGLSEVVPVEKATKRTTPRVEEPPPTVDPDDAAFTPEPLDNLDDIWNAPAVVPEQASPARVVLPPMAQRQGARAPHEASEPVRNRGLSRDEERYARRESSPARRERPEGRPVRRERPEGGRSPAPVPEFARFLPTGDAVLDDYLMQLDAEPDNYGLALAIGNLGARTGRSEIMSLAFKRLVRSGQAIEQLIAALEGLRGNVSDPAQRTAIARLLGDAYSKQGRFDEAMQAYNTTFGQ